MFDAMVDLETWGARPGCALRSISVAMFDPWSSEVGAEFDMNIDPDSCAELGLKIMPDTAAWWNKPDKSVAHAALQQNMRPAKEVAEEFVRWWGQQGAKRFWGQGGGFDAPITVAFLEACGMQAPWKFWDECCTRTAYLTGKFSPFAIRRRGTHHLGIDDCRHQILCVQAACANITHKREK